LQARRPACRWCSWAGFVNFQKQNRELPYASQRSKPGKVQVKRLSRWNKFVIRIKQACKGKAWFAGLRKKRISHVLVVRR